ncbi:MAG: hypothetical protein PSN37_00145 [Alphaproteobacteria bacterium]|nr:hypothetical protein [Alphaproteobacteria bacterium]
MRRKFFLIFCLIPFALVMIMLSVSNRHYVTFFLDPLGTADLSSSFRLPFFLFIFLFIFFGMLLGQVILWLKRRGFL